MVTNLSDGYEVEVTQGREHVGEIHAPIYNWGKVRRAVCNAQIDALFGSPTRMPLDVKDFFVHGVEGPRKWLLHLESTTARVLGTTVMGAVVFATFSLYLVPSHAQLGLFLAEPPFVSAFLLLCHELL